MFEITGDDIALLSDEDLRALVGLLCEAEVRSRGLPTSSVTYGGNQTAADGGVDVRVALPAETIIEGFVPRPATGLQVKRQDMPRGAILAEMRPEGLIRPVIQELANQSGAYIIVSSVGSTTDSVLQHRRAAMAEAVQDLPNAKDLRLDFYDRTRLASWVRSHAGLIPWVREKIGKAIHGWQSYGAWAYAPEGIGPEYLVDDQLRIRTGRHGAEAGVRALDGLQEMRDLLRAPRSVIRLVGLSGVGKTRLVQALFDDRVGERSLDSSLAIYTNLAHDPDPQPYGLASDLIAAGTRAILVVDNCPPDLHEQLSEFCRSPGSMVSVVTVEYDIREDQPEGTMVYTLEVSSQELIEKLVRYRFPEISVINARTIAECSGGNARIAIALAGTVDTSETIAGLTDEELFRRLFEQRHGSDQSLYRAAQACSLVYSFHGENVSDGDDAELIRLGALAGLSPEELYASVAELRRRDLIQQRSVWRAVLPHAIANRLAATALENIPFASIETQLINNAPERLLKSFSRRLGYLHGQQAAVAIVERWLASDGLLGAVAELNELGKAMFENVAPVVPEATLASLERNFLKPESDNAMRHAKDYVHVIRSLAYDAASFERCIALLVTIATLHDPNDRSNDARGVIVSLFYLYLSGTQATIEQRMHALEPVLRASDDGVRRLGVQALGAALEASFFTSSYQFEFGARPRDHGYWPRTHKEVRHWFSATLKLVEALACSDTPCAPLVRAALAEKFGGLWTIAHMHDDLDRVCRSIAAAHFWPEGWIAVRQTLKLDGKSFTPESRAQLIAIEELLRPNDLVQNVRAIVLSQRLTGIDLDDVEEDGIDDIRARMARTDALAQDLGKAVAGDEQAFCELLPELVSSNGRLWQLGRGLFEGAADAEAMWHRLVAGLAASPEVDQKPAVLCGFLYELHARTPVVANVLLDAAVTHETLARWYPALQITVGIDDDGVSRLHHSLQVGKAPIEMYDALSGGRATDHLSGQDLKDLLLGIAAKQGGREVALAILSMRLHSDSQRQQDPAPEIIDAACELMRQIPFTKDPREDYKLQVISKTCLIGDKGAAVVEEICRRLTVAVAKYETYAYHHEGLLDGLMTAQPTAALNGLCAADAAQLALGTRILNDTSRLRKNPLDAVPDNELIAWCNQDPAARYPAMASTITISPHLTEAGPRHWTTIALQLLEKASNRIEVLKAFVRQITVINGWSGSFAAILEANAKLLNELPAQPDAAIMAFLAQEKTRIAQMIKEERSAETGIHRHRDERFE
jgi:hypothetical protein